MGASESIVKIVTLLLNRTKNGAVAIAACFLSSIFAFETHAQYPFYAMQQVWILLKQEM